jgi:hypothetical protein
MILVHHKIVKLKNFNLIKPNLNLFILFLLKGPEI